MKEGTRNVLVGVFVLSSMVALGVLSVWFGEMPAWLGGAEWTLKITGVQQLSGVDEACPVNLNGVQIGRVKSIDFKDTQRPDLGVVIVTRIKNTYSVPQGALAKVYGATIGFGTGHIDIIVESGTRAPPLDKKNALIPGEMRSIIGELISKDLVNSVERTIVRFGDLAAAAEPVAKALAVIMEKRSVSEVDQLGAAEGGVQPNLSTVVERFDRLLASLNIVLGDENLQGDVKTAVGDLKSASGELRDLVLLWKTESEKISRNVNQLVDRAEVNLDHSFVKANRVLENLDDATRSMANVVRRIEDGEGTIGMLARDERLYEAATLSFQRLNEAVGTLQRILAKSEDDGYIRLGIETPIGVFPKKLSIDSEPPAAP